MTRRATRKPILLAVLGLAAACGNEEPATEPAIEAFTVDADRISVSGISSGAYMAGQLHVAHSSLFGGAALIGGGPYRCAAASMSRALGPCMQGGDMGIDQLAEFARGAANSGDIDALDNLADDAVWVFHGARDDVMHPDTSAAAAAFYAQFLPADNITHVTGVDVVHGFPTLAAGVACDEFAAPYLNACDYDAAGELLAALHGPLDERGAADGALRTIGQPGGADAGMLDEAFLYVPASCAAGAPCGVHVALHGCLQSSDFVGEAFVTGAGYNEWAETNRLLVLYPQVDSSKLAPMNPNGCWDWWGYTDQDYATRNGRQVRVIRAMLHALAGTTL